MVTIHEESGYEPNLEASPSYRHEIDLSGFEPESPGPEPRVMPLHYRSINLWPGQSRLKVDDLGAKTPIHFNLGYKHQAVGSGSNRTFNPSPDLVMTSPGCNSLEPATSVAEVGFEPTFFWL